MIINPRFPPHFRAPPTRNRPDDLRIPEESITACVGEMTRWSDEEDDELRTRLMRGETRPQIAAEMGRTRASVSGRIKRLGILKKELA